MKLNVTRKNLLFFKSLESIGISRLNLQNISDEDIIHIEKKLTAERKLNETISKNDIEQILFILKEYRTEIKSITLYECLYGILSGHAPSYMDSLRYHTKDEVARIKELVSVYFKEDVFNYIVENFKANNFENLRILLQFRLFLNTETIEFLISKMENKLEEALALLKQLPFPSVINKNIGYLRKKPIYSLMNDIHSNHFSPYVYIFLDFIVSHKSYASGTPFFDNLLYNLRTYNTSDPKMAQDITGVILKYGGQTRFIYFGILFIIGVVAIGVVALTTLSVPKTPPAYTPRTNFWANKRNDVLEEKAYLLAEQDIEMLNFVEARMFPIEDYKKVLPPLNASFHKYGNPFEVSIFSYDVANIKQTNKSVNIFNQTQKECVVLAYYYDFYDAVQKTYVPKRVNDLPKIYALYIPKNDSIKIDFQMTILRFYIGKRLRRFNNYRAYVYPDSVDRKFIEYSKIDSTLFKYGFTVTKENERKDKEQNLIISQPDPYHYKLEWTGRAAVYRFTDYLHKSKTQDSLQKDKPLVLPEKNDPLIREENSPGKISGAFSFLTSLR